MNLLHISDTHSFHNLIDTKDFEKYDIVVHSGDCSNYRDRYKNEQEVRDFIGWYSTLPIKYKIYVAGNHDTSIEAKLVTKSDFERNGIIYLENESITIDGIKFYGSPHTPNFGQWAFMKARDVLHNKVWQYIPDDTDVLIVHGPPKGVLDLSYDRNGNLEYCGCSALRKRIDKLEQLKLVLFGHIHDMDGITNHGVVRFGESPILYSNATMVKDGDFDSGIIHKGNEFIL